MKKCIFLSIVGLLFFSSCSKEDTLILGTWYFDTSACTNQYQYTTRYKNFRVAHGYDDLNDPFDESVHRNEYLYYGYWDFSMSEATFYYKYMDGLSYIGKVPLDYYINDGVLTFGATKYEILTLDKKQLVVQCKDTVYSMMSITKNNLRG